jgi:hypothetical protein
MKRQTLSFIASASAAPRGGQGVVPLVEEAPEKLDAYPSLRKAALILKVDPASLSRREDVKTRAIRRGREHLLTPDLVLELAGYYRKRRLSAVASDLLDLAVENAPDWVDEVEHEIDDALSSRRQPASVPDAVDFLREAKRALPTALYEQVETAYREHSSVSAGSSYLGEDDEDD